MQLVEYKEKGGAWIMMMLSRNGKISLKASVLLMFLHKQRDKSVLTAGQLTSYFTNYSARIHEIFRVRMTGGYVKEVLF